MNTALIKFLILWIMCENFVVTTSMALKEIANEDANTRQKRSPSSLFGFDLGNPVSTARESFSSIGNIFSGSRKSIQHNNYHEPIQPYGQPYERSTNTLSPISIPNRSGIPNSMAQDAFQKEDRYIWPQENKNEGFTLSPISSPNRSGIPKTMVQDDFQEGDRYVWPQENKSQGLKKTVPDKKQEPNTKPVPERNNEAPENTGDNPGNGDVDKQLLDYIFQKPEFNDDAGTTVDNSIDFITETGEYETTTGLDQRMLPAAAVATLLG